MNTIGIVSEYNPFHLGHHHQIKESVKKTGAQGVIALMSGSLTQRGEFSLFNKWEKSRLALSSGVDLVIELPVVFAGQSAEYFSSGAVRILELCGVCDFCVLAQNRVICMTFSPFHNYSLTSHRLLKKI